MDHEKCDGRHAKNHFPKRQICKNNSQLPIRVRKVLKINGASFQGANEEFPRRILFVFKAHTIRFRLAN